MQNWGEEPGEDILNVACKGMEDQQYLDLIENKKGKVKPKFSKPDAILREFAD